MAIQCQQPLKERHHHAVGKTKKTGLKIAREAQECEQSAQQRACNAFANSPDIHR